MLNVTIEQALKLVQSPDHVSVKGRALPPSMLFTPPLAEPLVYWLTASMSKRLLSHPNNHQEFIADPEHLMGMRRVVQHDISVSEYVNSHGAATQLLICAEAISDILTPSKINPKYDYGDLLVTFRDQVDYHYQPGSIVDPNDVHLHKILYNKLHAPRWQTPAPLKNANQSV